MNDTLKELLDMGNANVEIKNSYKNGMNTKTTIALNVSIKDKESKENVSIKLNLEAKFNSYNKAVNISIPKASKVYEG